MYMAEIFITYSPGSLVVPFDGYMAVHYIDFELKLKIKKNNFFVSGAEREKLCT